MKKIFTLIVAVLTMSAAQAQIVTVDFEDESWNALIDDAQYGGKLIYSPDEYKWQDKATSLSSVCTKADWGDWGWGWNNGIAISNYVDATATDYSKQLSVAVSNGSKNFAVVWDNGSEIAFADGKAHTIMGMDVINTAYPIGNMKKACGEGYFFKVIATGYAADGSTKSIDIMLAEEENIVEEWKNVNLSALGKVTKVVFTFEGSDMSGYGGGLATPKYFALDNIKVDMSNNAVVDFEAESWNALIDDAQYGGKLIYSADEYKWQDAATSLSSTCEKADWTAWGYGYGWDHGIAISNYVDETADGSDKQLSVKVSNGSKNFAVAWDNGSEIAFADGKARTIMSMDVINTGYALANITKNLGEGYFFKVVATGHTANGETKALDIMLAEDEKAVEEWKTIDLSSLGAVTKIVFTFEGSDMSGYGGGLATPKYFTLDNIVVDLDAVDAIKAVEMKSAANAKPVAYYSVNGKRYSEPQKGMNIIRMSDGTSRKVIIR